jgi:hypothetical protein
MMRKCRTLSTTVGMVFAFAVAAVMCMGGAATARAASDRPCDVYGKKTPCVAAFSTTRALYKAYKGPLYEVTRESDKKTMDIGLTADGYAKASAQDEFCGKSACTITKIYDQSPNHSDLTPAPPGGAAKGPGPQGDDVPAKADALPVTVGGHKVYGVAVPAGVGYRNDTAKETAVHGQPEGVYMVTSALDLNEKCCFDFGNAETNNLDNQAGHMDAINIMWRKGGYPDAGLDMEDGIYGHLKVPVGTQFVTVMGVTDGQKSFAIYQGNAQGDARGGALTSTGMVPLPKGYQPMQQEGAIILGIGGDNSNWATGYFFEGVMTKGMPDEAAMQAVEKNVVAAGYAGTLKR